MKENLMRQNAPHVRQSETVVTLMADVIIALLPIYLMCFFYYGARAIVLGICGVVSCVLISMLCDYLVYRKIETGDLTPVITGMMLALLMPANVPYYVLMTASLIAIAVVKLPFGGTGNNLFNPAIVGYAAVAICWPDKLFAFPQAMQSLSVFGENSVKTLQSAAHSLSIGAVPEYDLLDMLLGNCPGSMGTVHIIVIVACGAFLIVRNAVNWRTPAVFLLTFSMLSLIFPRISGSSFDAMCYELFSGSIVFGAFFMLSEPVTSPKKDFGKVLYSIAAALVAFLFRRFSSLEDGFAYSVIIMNVFSPLFDDICEDMLHLYRHKDKILSSMQKKKAAEASVPAEKIPAANVRVIMTEKQEPEILTEADSEPIEVKEEVFE